MMSEREAIARELFAFLTHQQFDSLRKDQSLDLDPREVYTKCLALVDFIGIDREDVRYVFTAWRDSY